MRAFEGGPLFAASLATQVTVLTGSGGLAQIYSAETGPATMGNPFFLTEVGKVQFWADAGDYSVTVDRGGESDNWQGRIGPYGVVNEIIAGSGISVDSSNIAEPVVTSRIKTNISTTSYTLSLTNENEIRELGSSLNINITVPNDSASALPIGYCHIIRPRNDYTGAAAIVADGGVTVSVSAPVSGSLNLVAGEAVAVIKMAINYWVVIGVTE
jgi:hypothetical protein